MKNAQQINDLGNPASTDGACISPVKPGNDLAKGAVFRAPYPFIRGKVTLMDEDGYSEVATWRPGVRADGMFADALGEIILTVVSVHKPGRFPTRVFFTRRWRSPAGREFGKSACRCVTAEKFRRLARGYAHEFAIEDSLALTGNRRRGQ
jgi:hypothetical protein